MALYHNRRILTQPVGAHVESKDLRKAGLKVTLPRVKILEILESSGNRHLSAEDIYRRLVDSREDIGLATVYRVLTQFEAANIVSRHNFDDGHAVYELAPDEHHDHMVDVDTGHVMEFMSERIERLGDEVSARRHLRTYERLTGG